MQEGSEKSVSSENVYGHKSLVIMAAKACDEKKAKDITLIKIDKVSFISEWILIAEGLSTYKLIYN